MTKIISVFLIFFIILACSESEPELSTNSKAQLDLANAYYNNGLYIAAVNTYQEYLKNSDLDENRRANTLFNIANIYFDRVKDYEKALEFYLKIKYLYPQSSLQGDVGKKIVNCLDRLDRSRDANRYMQQQAALDPQEQVASQPGEVIAVIGNRKITQGDLDFEISRLPAYVQEQLNSPQAKKEFLKQYVIQELLYSRAKKQELDKDKDVIQGTFRTQKTLMAEKVLQAELGEQPEISETDARMYYKANKERYAEKDESGKVTRELPFEEVAQRVAQDLAIERQQEAYQKLANRLIQENNVKIYETKVR